MLNAKCAQADLHNALQIVGRGVSGRSTQPVQNNVYLQAEGEQLRLVATDLEYISLDAAIPAVVIDEGNITVPPRTLTEIAGNLPEGQVSLQADESNDLAIACGPVHYNIRGLSADDFQMLPPLTDGVEFSLPQSELSEILQQTIFATSPDETRPILTGALFSLAEGSLAIVATDTYRLALRRVQCPVEETQQAIVSRRVLAELVRILDDESDEPVQVAISTNQVRFVVAGITVRSRLIEGEFPNYEKVIPEDFDKTLTIGTEGLQQVLRRALIVARDDANRVVLRSTEDGLQVTADSPDIGHAEEEVPATLEGEVVEIAFNVQYLLEMLEVANSEEVVMQLSGPLNPGMLIPAGRDDYTYVLMPMQIM